MLRWWIAVGLIAGVAAHGDAAARPSAQPGAPRSTAASPPAAKSRLTKSRHATASSQRTRRGRIARANGNMPRGFTWPPSRAMAAAEAACERALDAASVAWRPARREGHIADAVTIGDGRLGGISYVPVWGKGPHKLDCQLALALHTIGPELHAAGVREVRFGSIYRWSQVRVGGKTRNALSRHALGLAMDVVAFVDDTGRRASIAGDYPGGDPLLLAVERAINASDRFRLVLTPKNDPISHHDHFHIEANPSYAKPSYAKPSRKS